MPCFVGHSMMFSESGMPGRIFIASRQAAAVDIERRFCSPASLGSP